MQDKCAVIFAYYDFKQGILMVQDELVPDKPKMTTDSLSKEIKEKEKGLWGDIQPCRRIMDINAGTMRNTLQTTHNLTFILVKKRAVKVAPGSPSISNEGILHGMVNKLRIWMKNGRILIDPRCKYLIACLEGALWDEERVEWTRTEELGHADALAALIYLLWMIDDQTNPIPDDYKRKPSAFISPNYKRATEPNWKTQIEDNFENIMKESEMHFPNETEFDQ